MRKNFKWFPCILIAAVLMAGVQNAVADALPQPDPIIVSEDAAVVSNNPDTNDGEGTNMQLTAGDGRLPYMKFDLSSVRTMLLTYDIESVQLNVRMLGAVAGGSSTTRDMWVRAFHIIDDTWSSGTLNYNNRPTEGADASEEVFIPMGTSGHTLSFDITSSVISELKKLPEDNTYSCTIKGVSTGGNQTIVICSMEHISDNPPTLTVVYKEKVPETLTVSSKVFKTGTKKVLASFTVNDATVANTPFSMDITQPVAEEALKDGDNKISMLAFVENQTTSAGILFYRNLEAIDDGYKPQITVATSDDSYVLYPEIVARVRGGQYANNLAADAFEIKRGSREDDGARYVYLKFDISEIKNLDDIQSAELKITNAAVSNGEFDINIYYIENDDWDMSNLTMNNRPVIGTVIGEIPEEAEVLQAEVVLSSTYQSNKEYVAVWAVYQTSGGNAMKLQSVSTYPLSVKSNQQQELIYTHELPELTQGGNLVAKILLLDDLNSLTPQVEAITEG